MEKNICTKCGAENNIKAKYCSACGYELPIMQEKVTKVEPPINTALPKKKNKAVLIGILVGILVFAAVGFGIRSCAKSFIKNNGDKIIDKVLVMTAQESNKSCPMMVDEYTRLDSVSAIPSKTLQYHYTLIGFDVSKLQEDAVKENLNNSILANVKSNADLQQLKNMGTTFMYVYKDEKGTAIHEYKVTPEMYK